MKYDHIDYSLYLVTSAELAGGRTTQEIVEAAVRGGVTCVQLREKNCSALECIEKALSIKRILKPYNIPFIINDRVEVAQAVKADGVHLGQDDMPLSAAKAMMGDSMIIGISARSVADAVAAEKNGADYIGAGSIYRTSTKTDTGTPIGLEGLLTIKKAVNIPVIGIGGIHQDNAAAVIKNGADGIAVVSAIVSADNPEKAAEKLHANIIQARTSCT